MTLPKLTITGINPRDNWLRERVINCIEQLTFALEHEDWFIFKDNARIFAEELLYAVNEWDKYYPNKENK